MKNKSLITFIGSILVSFILVIGAYLVFNPIKVERENQATLEIIQSAMPKAQSFERQTLKTVGSIDVTLAVRVLDKDSVGLGYMYEMNAVNGFGNITILVAADVNNTIITVEITDFNQTMYQTQTQNLIKNYKGENLDKITDLNAGATSVSMNTVMNMFKDLSVYHEEIERFDNKLPYEDILGTKYEVTSTVDSTLDGASIKVDTLNQDLGFIYYVSKVGLAYTGKDAAVTLVIIINKDGLILGTDLPSDLYFHTKSYRDSMLEYAATFTGNLAELADFDAGATDSGIAFNTKTLVTELFRIAKEKFVQ